MRCSECFFFRGKDGGCTNPKSRFGYVGYFQEAGPCFAAKDAPEKENKTMAEEPKEIKRVCADCGRELPLEQFARNRSGYTKYCKECMKVRRGKGKQPGGNYHLPQAPLNVGIAAIGDEALMAELKKRGWSGRLTKTLEMEI
ncbi:MAG: hypothetical protein IJQ61_06125 [Bacteroidales bacterium]|nr:hypothetical protein [Bacteroidales bacterium]